MNTSMPPKRHAARGGRIVRASVAIGLAASVGLQMAGGGIEGHGATVRDASPDCGAPALAPAL